MHNNQTNTPSTRRSSRSLAKSIITSAITFFTIATLAACASTSTTRSNNNTDSAPTTQTAANNTNPDTVSMYVHGFGCPLCATNIERAMLGLRGVNSVDVDLGQGRVDVHTLPGIAPTRTQLAATVKDAGFTLVRFADETGAAQ